MIIKYPEIYCSNEICEILHSCPDIPEAPQAPIEPKSPINPGEYRGNGQGINIIMMIISIIGIIYCLKSDIIDDKVTMIFCGIGLFFLSWIGITIQNSEKEAHQNKVDKYEEETRLYPQKLRQYQKDLEVYEQNLQEYNKLIARLESPDNVLSFRQQLFRKWESSREFPVILDCEEDETIKKGVSEDYFFNLLQINGLNVYQNKKTPIGGKYYYPDILVIHGSIIIDIEIDEPYSGNDGTPIHYLCENYGIYSSSDENRNNFFCRNGFEIIRFAEEQIFLHTNDCISLIFQFISSISNSVEPCIPEELLIDKWTKDIAHKWAYQRFRNTYVPYELQKSISKEGEHQYEELRAEYSSQELSQEYYDSLPF